MVEDVRVAAFLRAKPGQEEAVRQAALDCVAPTRSEAGNEMYVLHRDKKDAALFVFGGALEKPAGARPAHANAALQGAGPDA